MEITTPSGSALKLELLLRNGDTSKFPQAHVFDSSNDQIAGSPFDLAHDELGNYVASSPPSPANGKYRAIYIIYNEVGHSTEAPIKRASDDFDVTPIAAQVSRLNTDYTTARAGNLDNLNATVSSRATQASVDTIDANVDSILVDTDTTIPAQITALNDPTVAQIADGVWDEPRVGHIAVGSFGENLDVSVGSRASQSSVSGIQNNTTFTAVFPDIFERPDSGTLPIKAFARLFDTEGNPEDPDSDVMNIRTELADGTVIIPTTAMTKTATGAYELASTIGSTDVLGIRYIFFEYVEGGISFQQVRQAILVENADVQSQILDNTAAILDDTGTDIPALIAALNDITIADVQTALTNQNYTTARGTLLSNLDVLLSTRSTQTSVNTIDAIVDAILVDTDITIPGLIAALENLSESDVQSAMTSQGYTSGRAPGLDNLDASISSREAESAASTRAGTNQTEHDQTQSDIAGLGSPSSPSVIADAVWDELRAGHVAIGSFGENLDAAVSTRALETSVASIQNNTNFSVAYPAILEIPETGTSAVKVLARLFNTEGAPEDPDSQVMNIRLEAADGTVELPTTPMSRTGVGQYEFTFPISNNEPLGRKYGFFEYVENSVPFQQVRVSEVVETADISKEILEKVNSIASTADPEVIADAVWDEVRSGHVAVGTFGENVDAKISSRESEADASNRAIAGAKETTLDAGFTLVAKDATVAKEGTLSGKSSQLSVDALAIIALAIKAKTDSMVFDGDKIRATALEVLDKAGYALTVADKADIVDKVWDEVIATHLTAGSTGKALNDSQAATDPLAIADAVWDESASDHAAPTSMGGKLNEARNESANNGVKNDTLLSRLSAGRAGNLDNIDATITSRQSEADAASRFGDLTADIANVVIILNGIAGDVSGSDPDNLSILQILNSATFGLAQLRIQLDAKSTLAQLATALAALVTIDGRLVDGSTGLAAIKAQSESNNSTLLDGNHGLPKLRSELDGKATSNQFSGVPTAIEIAAKIWDELTSNPRAAGSYGTLIKTNLDDKITTRATNTDLATVDTIVDDIKALLENGTFGLNALLDEINANEVKIDANGTAIADVDSDLAIARADILAAIALIVDGTPAIIAVLDEIKGAGYTEATDALKAISAKIAAGTATLGNQTSILTKLNDMHGAAPAASDNIKELGVKTSQNLSEIQANNTQIRDDVSTVDGKVDGITNEVAAVKARLDDTNFGLPKAKTDRDAFRSDILAGQGTQNSKLDSIEGKVDTVDGKVDSSEAAILAAINALDLSLISTNVQGIIALLQDGSTGLSAIKNAVIQVKNQEAANSSQIVGDINTLDGKIVTINGLVTAIQGVGFTASDSLVAVKAAVLAISTEHVGGSLEVTSQAILVELSKIQDGEAGGFDGTVHGLKKIAEQGSQLSGFEGGEA